MSLRRSLAAALALGVLGCGGEAAPDSERIEHGASGVPQRARTYSVPGATPEQGRPPNLVVILTDDQDARSLDAMPAVQRLLVRRGTDFRHNFATFPLCCPSRATLLTGQYTHNHGVVDNHPPDGGYGAFKARRDTLGAWLQEAGYRTAWVGKYLNGYGLEGDYQIPPGWSEWVAPVELGDIHMFDYRLNEDGEIVSYGGSEHDYQVDVLAGHARGFVAEASERRDPFALFFSPPVPHTEADSVDTGDRDPRPPPRHRGAYDGEPLPRPPSFDEPDLADKPRAVRVPRLGARDRAEMLANHRGRLESLLAVDDAVAELVAALRRAGELRRTVVVFTSDNGYLLGEHRLYGKPPYPYEELARVPLVIRGPGFEPAPRRTLAGNVDLAPTLLDLAGAKPTRPLDGRSLANLTPLGPIDRHLVLETTAARGLRTHRFAYIEHDGGGRELYDLRRDPFQLESVIGDPAYGRVERALARRLTELRDCAGAPCREEFLEPRPTRRP